MEDSGIVPLDGSRSISGEGSAYRCKGFNSQLFAYFVEQQYFKFFFAAVEWGAFLFFLGSHLFAQVTFTMTGRIGLRAVLTQGSSYSTLINGKTHYQPAFAKGLCHYDHQQ